MYNVFIADDEPWILVALKNLIDWRSAGFLISGEAHDGKLALERIEKTQPHLIISDIRMPGLNGLELLETIREKEWPSEVILISGYSDFEYARKAMRFGCIGYLLKPVDDLELAEYLKLAKSKLDKRNQIVESEQDSCVDYVSERQMAHNMEKYIQDNFAGPISLQRMSEEFNLSESHISNIIKKNTGKNFSSHLVGCRIKKAQALLRTTNDSIDDIAEKVGYPDYFYFIKVFKKTTGISPTCYRKQL
jgi:two-component system response regulator YesN